MLRRPPASPPFPYTTLFRSRRLRPADHPRPGLRRAHAGAAAADARGRGEGVCLEYRGIPEAGARVGRLLQVGGPRRLHAERDRKSTRLNSSHLGISYAVFFLNATAPTCISTLSLHDALPISSASAC